MSGDDEPRFIVDNMLGSIARWLRILGYDTVYDRDADDWQIIRRAELEKRIIVTRDRALHNKALKYGLKSILLWEDEIEGRLAHIAFVTGIRLGVDFTKTRCPEDNTPLIKVDKERVKDKIPPGVYRLHSDFWVCSRCGKVYWVGRHWRTIDTILSRSREDLEKLRERTKR